MKEKLEFVDDKLFVYTPLPQYGNWIYKTQLVMTKEIFQECYKKWIEENENTHTINVQPIPDQETQNNILIKKTLGYTLPEG